VFPDFEPFHVLSSEDGYYLHAFCARGVKEQENKERQRAGVKALPEVILGTAIRGASLGFFSALSVVLPESQATTVGGILKVVSCSASSCA